MIELVRRDGMNTDLLIVRLILGECDTIREAWSSLVEFLEQLVIDNVLMLRLFIRHIVFGIGATVRATALVYLVVLALRDVGMVFLPSGWVLLFALGFVLGLLLGGSLRWLFLDRWSSLLLLCLNMREHLGGGLLSWQRIYDLLFLFLRNDYVQHLLSFGIGLCFLLRGGDLQGNVRLNLYLWLLYWLFFSWFLLDDLLIGLLHDLLDVLEVFTV